MTNQSILHLFQSCVPVKGHTRSTICDLERQRFYYIPNSMYDFLKTYHHATHQSMLDSIDKENHTIIQEYLDFLFENELAVWIPATDAALFIKMPEVWKSYSVISNMIIELSQQTIEKKDSLLELIKQFQTEAIGLLISDKFDLNKVIEFIKHFEGSCIRSFDLIFNISIDNESAIVNQIKKISYVFGVRFFKSIRDGKEYLTYPDNLLIIQSKMDYNTSLNHYKASADTFKVNNPLFFESKIYNSYFNQKLFIDKNAQVSNAANTPSFCHVDDLIAGDPKSIINNTKKLWSINKTKVALCKSCEHRFICVDTRVPILRAATNKGQYYYENSCGYDPMKGEWLKDR